MKAGSVQVSSFISSLRLRFGNVLLTPPMALTAIAILTFLTYSQSLGFDFVYDDIPLIADNPMIRCLGNIPEMFVHEDKLDVETTGYYRPLIPVIDSIVYAVFGASAQWFHLFSVLYHLIATALVYFLALRVTGSAIGAFIAGVLFGLHPVNTEAVAFVTAKNNVLCAIFTLGSVLCFLRYREPGRELGEGRFLLAASAALLFLGTLCKEFALMGPFVLLAFEGLRGEFYLRRRGALAAYLPLALVVVLYLGIRAIVLGANQGAGLALGTLYLRLAAMPEVLLSYLRLAFLPVRQSALYAFVLEPSLMSAFAALGLVLVMLAAFGRRWRGIAAFPVAWFFLFLMPVTNVFALSGSPMAERSLYLPLAGLVILAANLYGRYETGRWTMAATICVMVCFAALTFARIPVWKNDEALYTHMTEVAPESYKGWYNLGVTMFDQGRFDEARMSWERTLELNPRMPVVRLNLAVLYEQGGDFKQAERFYREVLAESPMSAAYNNLGNVLVRQGRLQEAEEAYRSAIEMEPSFVEPYMALAGLHERAGRIDEALLMLQGGLGNASEAPSALNSALFNKAGAVLGKAGRYGEAYEYFRQALKADPSCAQCMYNLRQVKNLMAEAGGKD